MNTRTFTTNGYFSVLFFCLLFLSGSKVASQQLTEWNNYQNCDWVNCLLSDGDYLWIATTGGLIKMDKHTGEKKWYNHSSTGLPENRILSLAKDKNGKLWMGTRSKGIACLDDEECTVYNTTNSDISGDIYCAAFVIDEEGNKWFGNLPNLNKYDGTHWHTWTTPYSDYASFWCIYSMKFDTDGVLWIGGTASGPSPCQWAFARFDGGEGMEVLELSCSVLGVEIDDNNIKWLATDQGLMKYDGTDFTVYDTTNSTLPYDNLQDVMLDREGNLWMIGGSYLTRYDGTEFTTYQVPFIYSEDWLTCLAPDEGEDIWIGTRYEGLLRFRQGTFERINCNNTSLTSNSVTFCADVDRDNKFWTATTSEVVVVGADNHWSLIGDKGASALRCSPEGHVWVGLDRGDTIALKINATDTIAYTLKNVPDEERIFVSFNDFAFDKKGNVWAASRSGLHRYDGNKWSVLTPDNIPIASYNISALAVDNEDNLWVASAEPVYQIGNLCKYDGKEWTVYTPDNTGMPTFFVATMAFDSQNVLWLSCRDEKNVVGTDFGGGLTRFDGTSWRSYNIENSRIPSNTIMDIVVDKQDHLWLATYSQGLTFFDGTNWKVYDIDNSGLAWNNISKITLDYARDVIWLNLLDNNGLATAKLNGLGSGIVRDELSGDESVFSIYPNPARDVVSFRFGEGIQPDYIAVYDLCGRLLCRKSLYAFSCSLAELNIGKEGLYLIKLTDRGGNTHTCRLMVVE